MGYSRALEESAEQNIPVFGAEKQTENFPCERVNQHNRLNKHVRRGGRYKAFLHILMFPTTIANSYCCIAFLIHSAIKHTASY